LTLCPREYSVSRASKSDQGETWPVLARPTILQRSAHAWKSCAATAHGCGAAATPSAEPRTSAAGEKPSSEEKPGLSPAIRRVLYRSAAKAPGE